MSHKRYQFIWHIFLYSVFLILFLNVSFSMISQSVQADQTSEQTSEGFTRREIPDSPATAADAVNLQANSAILVELNHHQILYEKNSDQQISPGGLVKFLTFSTTESLGQDLNPDLTYWMMMDSGKDASSLLVENTGEKQSDFIQKMQDLAVQEGCLSSEFHGISGSDEEKNLSTAYDIACIAASAYQSDLMKKILSSITYQVTGTSQYPAKELWQQNLMIDPNQSVYDASCRGGRFGYTEDGGTNFAVFAEKDGMQLLAVLMDDTSVSAAYEDAETLFQFGFDNFTVMHPLEESFVCTDTDANDIDWNYSHLAKKVDLQTSYDSSVSVITGKDMNQSGFQKKVQYYAKPSGHTIGEIQILWEGQEIASTDLQTSVILSPSTPSDAGEKVQSGEYSSTDQKKVYLILSAICLLALSLILYMIHRIHKKSEKTVFHYKPSKASQKIHEKNKVNENKLDQGKD